MRVTRGPAINVLVTGKDRDGQDPLTSRRANAVLDLQPVGTESHSSSPLLYRLPSTEEGGSGDLTLAANVQCPDTIGKARLRWT